MKRILMIAYHFPPLSGSSGIQRTLRFVQHLPKFGWEPLVLTTHVRAYESTSNDQLAEIPGSIIVKRAFALDTARHLSIAGRYPGFLARPDRWMSWQFDGIRQGMQLIKKYQPRIIWSTFPIATAHLIGAELQRRSGLPWVADFRDPMAQDGYPTDPITWQHFKRIEERVMHQASLMLFTTPGAARMYRERYPTANVHIEVLENGYDEETFTKADKALGERLPLNPGHLTLLHSGIVYPTERDPSALFEALGKLKRTRPLVAEKLKLRFRAAVHDDLLRRLASKNQVEDMIEIMPAIPYREALTEMLCADGLLIMQGGSCNAQIPAKLYEYMRALRPIIGLTDPHGDTASTLSAVGINTISSLEDAASMESLLLSFVANPSANDFLPKPNQVKAMSRERRTADLALWLDSMTH